MIYAEKIIVDKKELEFINKALTFNAQTEEEQIMGEDDVIRNTAVFQNGYFMDIKCCGVQYDCPEGCNTAWSEAVLFDDEGYEVACTEVGDEYLGMWELEDGKGNIYCCEVVA